MIRFLTAGESHGKAIVVIIEGFPSNLPVDFDLLDRDLSRRKQGYGRGGRMSIETDSYEILAGVRYGKTIGSPISVIIRNNDFENYGEMMSVYETEQAPEPTTIPRPGHADLSGSMKYNFHDIRNVIERSSARETAMRTVAGAFAKMLLQQFNITVCSFVESIGGIYPKDDLFGRICEKDCSTGFLEKLCAEAGKSSVRVTDSEQEQLIRKGIDEAREKGDSLGGTIITAAVNVPAGLGSYVHYDRRLDSALTAAIMSINGIKGVEIGSAFTGAAATGTKVHDGISVEDAAPVRHTNRAGGLEGGMSNGMPVLIRSAMKPIPTTKQPLQSIELTSGVKAASRYERSDITAVPACSIVTEAMTAFTIADFFLRKFGGDSLEEIVSNHRAFRRAAEKFFHP